jgi:hypothetical protein
MPDKLTKRLAIANRSNIGRDYQALDGAKSICYRNLPRQPRDDYFPSIVFHHADDSAADDAGHTDGNDFSS